MAVRIKINPHGIEYQICENCGHSRPLYARDTYDPNAWFKYHALASCRPLIIQQLPFKLKGEK